MTDALTRAVLLEAMARAHCRHNLECDPDELGECSGLPIWQLHVAEMEPLLDVVLTTLQRGWRERRVVATLMREAA